MKLQMIRPRVALLRPAGARTPAIVRIRGNTLQRIRERVLSDACGLCQCVRCKADGVARMATIVDHVVPLWAGGPDADGNRQAISSECHELKSAHEAQCRSRGVFEPWGGGVVGTFGRGRR